MICPGTGAPSRGPAICPVCGKTVPAKGGRLRRHALPDDPARRERIREKLKRMG
jgi:hypothetical protein